MPARETTSTRSRRWRRARRADRSAITAHCPYIAAICFAAALACLAAIGPPPWLRIDPLWVNSHRAAIELLLVCLVTGLVFSLLGLARRSSRLASVVVVLLFMTAGVMLFSDRLTIIGRVLISHLGG